MENPTQSILYHALKLAENGFAVIPVYTLAFHSQRQQWVCTCHKKNNCPHPGKHPCYKKELIEHGVKNATKDPDLIKAYWTAFPNANIGIATGKVSGVIVLDIDKRHNGFESLKTIEDTFSKIPKKCCVKTGGGGLHIYLPYPPNVNRVLSNPSLMGLPGIEVKGDGGLVNAPPSLHLSGERYTWQT